MNITECLPLVADKIAVDFYPEFLSTKKAEELERYLNQKLEWKKGRRSNFTFGDKGLVYEVKFSQKTVQREAIPWDPELVKIRDLVSKLTSEKFTICVVMRYPTGKVGINPHRDKEMKHGTMIAGVSLGETRTLVVSRGKTSHEWELPTGSLYVLKPPTNDYWSHEIPKDATINARISLTFRNY